MEKLLPRVSAVILAGGKSRRMGRDKAFLEIDGKPLITRVIECVEKVCAESLIVANDIELYRQFGLQVVRDVLPGKGSLGGLYSGLLAAQEQFIFAFACDMPFLNPDLMQYMISLIPAYDVVIPHARGVSSKTPRSSRERQPRPDTIAPRPDQSLAKEQDLHPLHAIYSKQCLPAMTEHLRLDDLRLISVLPEVRTRVIDENEIDRFDPRHLSFFNANTPEDFEIAKRLMNNV